MYMHLNPCLQAALTRAVCSGVDSTAVALPSQKHVLSCGQQQKRVALKALRRSSTGSSSQTLSPRSERSQHAVAPEDLTPLQGHQTPETGRRRGKGEWDPYKCPVQTREEEMSWWVFPQLAGQRYTEGLQCCQSTGTGHHGTSRRNKVWGRWRAGRTGIQWIVLLLFS